MGGVRLGGTAVFVPPVDVPPYPYFAWESGSVNAVWLMGNNMTPLRLGNTAGAKMSNISVCPTDPALSLFCMIGFSDVTIYTVTHDASGGTLTAVVTSSSFPGGVPTDLMPYWHPNGTTIVYRAWDGSKWQIRSIESDGSADTLLYEEASVALVCPCYSFAGDFIAVGRGRGSGLGSQLCVMDADGSNFTVLDTTNTASYLQWSVPYTYPSWQNAADVIGWMVMEANLPGNSVWKKCNADGTGLTTLLTTAHAANPAVPNVQWLGSSRFCWLADDSAMVSFKIDSGAWRLATIDGAGGGDSFLGNHVRADTPSNPFGQTSHMGCPHMFRNEIGDGRIYWSPAGSGSLVDYDVVSVEADDSGLRTDDDGTESPAHGYFAITGLAD